MPAPAGTPCDDGDPCNGEEASNGASACTLAAAPAIDDGEPCTLDACDPETGITHTACSALDLTAGTAVGAAAAFLHGGPNPVQIGVAPGTIEMRRAAAGASSVVFSQPLPFHIENFLGFPVGMDVPIWVLVVEVQLGIDLRKRYSWPMAKGMAAGTAAGMAAGKAAGRAEGVARG